MNLRGRLTYANVTATLALCVALATGGAYAQSRIGTNEIQNRAVTGSKIHKNTVRGGVHLRNNTVPGNKVKESTLNALRFAAIGGDSQELQCDPDAGLFENCASVSLDLPARGRALVVASGASFSEEEDEHANGRCEIRTNGEPAGIGQTLGELSEVNTSLSEADGFARTLVTPLLPPGPVEFSLACDQSGSADFQIQGPTIAAIALTNGRR